MSTKYTIRRPAPRTGPCDGCQRIRNRLGLYPTAVGPRTALLCVYCLGMDSARRNRLDVLNASREADLRAALDHGTNVDICRAALALSLRVRLATNGTMEVYS